MKNVFRIFIAFCFLCAFGSAHAAIVIPEKLPQELVVDYAGMLTPEQKAELSKKLHAYHEKTSNVFVVVTIPSLKETGIATYHDWNMMLADRWKPGDAKNSNGLIITISGKTAPYHGRINPGRGLTGALTDVFCVRLFQDTLAPALANDYYAGILLAVDALSKQAEGEFTTEKKHAQSASPDFPAGAIIIMVVGVLLAFVVGFGSPLFSAVVGAIAGMLVAQVVPYEGSMFAIAIILGLIIGFMVGLIGRAGGSNGAGDDYFFLGGSGGGSSGSSSGGDFDGGGGGFDD